MTRDDDLENPYYVRMMGGTVGRFGAYLMERAFDVGMDSGIGTLDGKWRSERDQQLAQRLESLSVDERDAVVEVVRQSLISAFHGLMHGLSHDEDRIRLIFQGLDIANESDGLHGDFFLWLRDLSRFPYDVFEES